MKKLASITLLILSTTNLNAAAFRRVYLSCQNPGSHQDVAKTPIIKNNTRSPISANTKIYWNSSDGDNGYIYGPLAVNESKTALGNPGNGYNCESYYLVRIP
jgi:hypothetical protein